jgi:hypothetical protein
MIRTLPVAIIASALAALLSASQAADSATAPTCVGWRGDGTGCYPNANPPVEWHRRVNGEFGLACSAKKPGAEVPPLEKTIAFGLREWLCLGPWITADRIKSMTDELIPEKTVEPELGAKGGDFTWEALPMDEHLANLAAKFGEVPLKPGQQPWDVKDVKVVYAHTYIYTEQEGPVHLRITASQGLKVFLNGACVGDYTKTRDAAVSDGPVLKLNKGWNRLLLKLWGYNPIWGFRAWIEKPPAQHKDYDSKNIQWTVNSFGGGISPPIVLGDKIFMCVEPHYLVCLRKSDGKPLWIRSNTYFDAALEKLKKEPTSLDSTIAGKAGDLLTKLQEVNDGLVRQANGDSNKRDWGKERGALDQQLSELIKEADAPRYNALKGAWELSQPGWSTCPCSDGKSVLVFFENSIAARYDLDGKRKWITSVDFPGNSHHGFGAAPVICDGKFITKQSKMNAFNIETGAVEWQRGGAGPYASLVTARCGADSVILDVGTAVNARNGEVYGGITGLFPWNTIATHSVFNGNTFANLGDHGLFRVIELNGGKAHTKDIKMGCMSLGGGDWAGGLIASPIVRDGFAYMVTEGGLLVVIDLQAQKEAYHKQLDSRSRFAYVNMPGLVGSPSFAGKYLYIMDDYCTTFVVETGPKFKQVSRNILHSIEPNWADPCGQQMTMSTPIFDENRMYVRIGGSLWCIGEK